MSFIKTLKNNKGFFALLLGIITVKSSIVDWNYVPTGSMRPTLADGDQILINKVAYDITIPLTYISLKKMGDPERGDIVVFDTKNQEHRMVKRVLGVPGDKFSMKNDMLYINDEEAKYTENYTSESIETTFKTLDDWDTKDYQASGSNIDNLTIDYKYEVLGNMAHPIRIEKGVQEIDSLRVKEFVVPEGKYFMVGDNRYNSYDSRFWGFVDRTEIVGKVNHVVFSLDQDNYLKPRTNRFFKKIQ